MKSNFLFLATKNVKIGIILTQVRTKEKKFNQTLTFVIKNMSMNNYLL